MDVAIVGMGCRFPGADDLSTFWQNILDAREAITDVPPDRWDPEVFHDPTSTANDRVPSRRGGYLSDPIPFDPIAHGIMPVTVEGGEPEQFLILDAARAALADAGMPEGVLDGRRVEVVVGRGNYFNRGNLTRLQHGRIVAQTLAILTSLHPEWSAEDLEAVRADFKQCLPPFGAATIAGQVTNATAGRVAKRLDLSGASFIVDAASASSLVAVDLGARALIERRADLALVGAVYLSCDVDFPMVFAQLGALSRTGSVRPFDQAADGTLPGEGVGVLVLKRLADAERADDRIYAVIKGIGIASDGRAQGLTAPSARGHARAIRRAYRRAGAKPETIGLIEGHGLGVPAADHAELSAMRAVFHVPVAAADAHPTSANGSGPHRAAPASTVAPERNGHSSQQARTNRIALGAVGSMIGHAMPAAGMAGLIKTALALYHRVLPPTLHADEAHPLLRDDASPFELNRTTRPWIHGGFDHPRRAAVNAFGFAGISTHAVLEEHPASAERARPGCQLRWESECILLGAPDRAHWIELAQALLDWLTQEPDVSLKDLAYTLNTGAPAFPVRVGFVAMSLTDLKDKLQSALVRLTDESCRAIRDARGTYFWDEPLGRTGKLAFLYPGEGSQYHGMLAELCLHFPEVRAVFDTADRVAREQNHPRLPSALLFDPSAQQQDDLSSMESAIIVVLSAQWALHQILRRLGLTPDTTLGHSSGEFLSLAAAGVLRVDRTLEDRLGELGTLFERLEHSGAVPSATLLAVAADRTRVEAACEGLDGDLLVAIDNCPHQVVLAGPPDAVTRVAARLRDEGILFDTLPFARAYHSPRFEPAVAPVKRFFDRLDVTRPRIPVYSCATADRLPDDPDEIRRLAVGQWTMPVRFRSTIEKMHEDGVRLFVEVGARGNLTGFVEDTLRGKSAFAIAANLPKRSALTQLNHLIASLWAQGINLKPDALYARRRPERLDLSVVPKAKACPVLAIGFPEMRLSDPLVQTLRSTHGRNAAQSAPQVSVDSRAPQEGVDWTLPSGIDATPGSQRRNVASLPGANADLDDGMLQYLRTMDAFLETQRQVMDAYLERSRVASELSPQVARENTPDAPVITDDSAVKARHVAKPPLSHVTAIASETVAIEVECAAPPPTFESKLLGRISQRTGYPIEMLQLDLDLEGDLGIDSIKRVEIFGDLRDQVGLFDDFDLDRLSRCRTLREILEVVGGQTEPSVARRLVRADECKAQSSADDRAVGPWVGEIQSLIPGRALVAERMLDMHADPVAEHHTLGGRRVSAIEPHLKGLPVVPFTVMAEMLAEAAAVLVPGNALLALRDVQAHRWICYEEEPVALEIHAERDPQLPDEVRISIFNRGTVRAPRDSNDGPVVEGRAVFGASRPEPTPAGPWILKDAGKSRFVADEIYRDRWLFHGPIFQAVIHIGLSSLSGIEGTLRVLPRRALLPADEPGALLTDAIVLDAFTHLLGCWGVDKLREGDVIFPLRLDALTFHGSDPEEGSEVSCRIQIVDIQRHRVRADVEFVRPDGSLWMRIQGWEDWRFYWPNRYRDQFRAPEHFLLGEAIPLPGAREKQCRDLCAVWLEPPADMGRPVWRDVLEWVQLGPAERAALQAQKGTDQQRTLRLWGRIAAKEAARRLKLDEGGASVYPSDLVIHTDSRGRPTLQTLIEPARDDVPAISIAHTDGVAVALASRRTGDRIGVDVERVVERGPSFEAVAFSPAERALLDRVANAASRSEWIARLWCAKEALAKATGQGLLVGPSSVAVIDADSASGTVRAVLGPELAAACPGWGEEPSSIITTRRAGYAWAWTLREQCGVRRADEDHLECDGGDERISSSFGNREKRTPREGATSAATTPSTPILPHKGQRSV
jgi:acyl transferase domain-containing protein/phosphopantetheinyl transferase